MFVDALQVRFDPTHTVLCEGVASIGQDRNGLEQGEGQQRLEDVQLEVAHGAGHTDRRVVAIHLTGHHGDHLTLGGVDLARHDRAARFIGRQVDLAQAAPGTAAEPTDVIGDLHQSGGQGLQRTGSRNHRIVGGHGGKLVFDGSKRVSGDATDLLGHHGGIGLFGIDAGPDGRPADAEFSEVIQRVFDDLPGLPQLCGISGELLAQRERRRILQVGASDLDDVFECL